MDVWFCVTQEPRREAQPRTDEHAETQTRALLSATDVLAPLDKDLSWKSAYRTSGFDGSNVRDALRVQMVDATLARKSTCRSLEGSRKRQFDQVELPLESTPEKDVGLSLRS